MARRLIGLCTVAATLMAATVAAARTPWRGFAGRETHRAQLVVKDGTAQAAWQAVARRLALIGVRGEAAISDEKHLTVTLRDVRDGDRLIRALIAPRLVTAHLIRNDQRLAATKAAPAPVEPASPWAAQVTPSARLFVEDEAVEAAGLRPAIAARSRAEVVALLPRLAREPGEVAAIQCLPDASRCFGWAMSERDVVDGAVVSAWVVGDELRVQIERAAAARAGQLVAENVGRRLAFAVAGEIVAAPILPPGHPDEGRVHLRLRAPELTPDSTVISVGEAVAPLLIDPPLVVRIAVVAR